MSIEPTPPPLVGEAEVDVDEQIAVSVRFAIDGFGLTTTLTVLLAEQPLAVIV